MNKLKEEIDAGEIPKEIEFYFGGPNQNFFIMYSSLNLNRENSDFIDFLSLDIGSQIFMENMLWIHIETGIIFCDNYNTNEPIYDFLLKQQEETKKNTIYTTLTYKDSFSNYLRCFLGDISAESVDKFDFFTNKNVKYVFNKFNHYLLFNGLNISPVRHSKNGENEIIMKEVQNRDWQYLVESEKQLVENNKSHLKPLPKSEKKIIKSMKHDYRIVP